MKWHEHRRITKQVCQALGVSSEITHKLLDAVILPDKVPDIIYSNGRKRRIPHHSYEALRLAWDYIKEARLRLLRGEDFTEPLGRAIHYIQDYVVDPTKKILIFTFRSQDAHDSIENTLLNVRIDPKDIFEGSTVRQPNKFKERLLCAKKYRDPDQIMKEATFLTASAIAVVLYPEREGRNYRKCLIRHVLLTLAPFSALPFGLKILPLCLVFSWILHKLDIPYHKAKLEKIWFG